MNYLLIALIRIYQWTLSPFLAVAVGPFAGCRSDISCSEYTIRAIQSEGVVQGALAGVKRIARCNSFFS